MDFFSAKELDKSMHKRITDYIDKFRDKDFDELIDKDWQSNELICPFCRIQFRDYALFLRHFRFKKHRWELKLLQRIYDYGPRQLEIFDIFYQKDGLDYELCSKVRLWVLALKIFEALDMMPYWKTDTEMKTKNYTNRLFWEKDKKAKEIN